MKSLKAYVSCALMLGVIESQAGTLCEARLRDGPSRSRSVVLSQNTSADQMTRHFGILAGYQIQIVELASANQKNPTMRLAVKNSTGIVLQTMMPSPGPLSGEAFVRTDLQCSDGIITIKCISK